MLHSQQPNQLVRGDDVVELLPQDVPLVLMVLDAHVLPVNGVDDSRVEGCCNIYYHGTISSSTFCHWVGRAKHGQMLCV